MNVQKRRSPASKRTTNACFACRERKVKCSGSEPCSACARRGDDCIYEEADQRRVTVSEGYLNRLKRKYSEHSRGNGEIASQNSPGRASNASLSSPILPAAERTSPTDDLIRSPSECPVAPSSGCASERLTNPLVSGSARYLTDDAGRKRYLGPSSSWNFGLQAWRILNEALGHAPTPLNASRLDGTAYDIDWPQTAPPEPGKEDMPTLDYAIYLVNTVKFHLGQLYHIFDEATFEARLREFYLSGPEECRKFSNVWRSQLLVVLAFGKAFLARASCDTRPPGAHYFERAMMLLPTVNQLYSDPMTSIETYCAIALYEQSIEHRNSSYTHLGIALRVAFSIGLHHEPSSEDFSPQEQTRRQSAWWTLYVLELHFSALMGAPVAVQAEDITMPMPLEDPTDLRSTALCTYVKLSRVLSKIIKTVYGIEGRLTAGFVPAIQAALRELATIASNIQLCFPIPADGHSSISRVAATLNMTHHHCVTLATRPLVLSLLKHRIHPLEGSSHSGSRISGAVRVLLDTALSSTMKSIRILDVLLDQDLIEPFNSFDLECVSSAAPLCSLVRFLAPEAFPNSTTTMSSVYRILDAMISRGSRPASFRKLDLQRLDEMIDEFIATGSTRAQVTSHTRVLPEAVSGSTVPISSVPFNPRVNNYVSPISQTIASEHNPEQDLTSALDSVDMLSPGQLLGIASLFDQAPEFLDGDGFNNDQSWLWSN